MPTQTRFVLLMHPKEFKREKAGTGRLTHLCLPNSEIQVGVEFDRHRAVQALIDDPSNAVHLLYPGEQAVNLSAGQLVPADLDGRRLVILVLDATWSCARKMLKLSPSLQRLPRLMITPSKVSRFVIKQQPWAGCLSTLESVHEVLTALADSQLDTYAQPAQLLELFDRMQAYQIRCATDPDRGGYRRSEYKAPGERTPFRGRSARRRANFFREPLAGDQSAAGTSP